MARLCKKGGFLINSMTKQYADVSKLGQHKYFKTEIISQFVDEYKHIEQYMEELEEEGTWKLMFRRVLDQYTKGNQGLVHAMRVL